MSKIASTSLGSINEGLVCFVCDCAVVGRYYTLASCRTQANKVRVVEKLGQLVGEEYMVIVSEDDIICRGCATMINSLDRLEKELTSLRSMVLRYLEKKYALQDGELVNSRSNVTARDLVKPDTGKNDLLDFTARKRKAMCGEVNIEDLKDSKDAMWLQCDRCKYTLTQNPNATQPQPIVKPVEQPVLPKTVEKPTIHQVQRIVQPEVQAEQMFMQQLQPSNKQNGSDKSFIRMDSFADEVTMGNVARTEHVVEVKKDEDDPMEDTETAEMITADIAPNFQDGPDVSAVETGQMLMDSGKQLTLQSVESEDGTNTLCMVDENGMIVQKVEQAEDGTLYVQMPDGSDPSKQMLSVTEDGSVEMVEVLWGDDIAHGDDAEAHSIVNF